MGKHIWTTKVIARSSTKAKVKTNHKRAQETLKHKVNLTIRVHQIRIKTINNTSLGSGTTRGETTRRQRQHQLLNYLPLRRPLPHNPPLITTKSSTQKSKTMQLQQVHLKSHATLSYRHQSSCHHL